MTCVQRLLAVPILCGKRDELYRAVTERIGEGGIVTSANPCILASAAEDERLFSVLSRSLCIPDGIGVKLALHRRGAETDVLPGVELGEEILKEGIRFAVIGGEEGIACHAAKALTERHPGSICLFTADGYLDSTLLDGSPSPSITSAVAVTRPDAVFLCLGSPKQEYFADTLSAISPRTLFFCLGGSADVYAGKKKRPPKLVRRAGCEWIYRAFCDPKRIRRFPLLFDFLLLSEAERRYFHKTRSGKF